ncbi:hypothetical protein J8273_7695 [Carpediemonas membranifera]|uniref:Uncharacterized protein n=1 Tax=Carpediemonas membranifera TaxID=201153 RepID=A0A8J6B0G4_9EUKA|nr:hypothetical protein J8273_7695 [Carpediemonas membranifera]|eukprot:KAG9390347.1 hypothetical protein J8273_7695 [Carpediemonas membranifera]
MSNLEQLEEQRDKLMAEVQSLRKGLATTARKAEARQSATDNQVSREFLLEGFLKTQMHTNTLINDYTNRIISAKKALEDHVANYRSTPAAAALERQILHNIDPNEHESAYPPLFTLTPSSILSAAIEHCEEQGMSVAATTLPQPTVAVDADDTTLTVADLQKIHLTQWVMAEEAEAELSAQPRCNERNPAYLAAAEAACDDIIAKLTERLKDSSQGRSEAQSERIAALEETLDESKRRLTALWTENRVAAAEFGLRRNIVPAKLPAEWDFSACNSTELEAFGRVDLDALRSIDPARDIAQVSIAQSHGSSKPRDAKASVSVNSDTATAIAQSVAKIDTARESTDETVTTLRDSIKESLLAVKDGMADLTAAGEAMAVWVSEPVGGLVAGGDWKAVRESLNTKVLQSVR